MLDCKPFMMRGVSYSPVPWNHDPSYHEPYGDYFTDEYHDIVKRDLALFQEMGANTVRLYAWRLAGCGGSASVGPLCSGVPSQWAVAGRGFSLWYRGGAQRPSGVRRHRW